MLTGGWSGQQQSSAPYKGGAAPGRSSVPRGRAPSDRPHPYGGGQGRGMPRY